MGADESLIARALGIETEGVSVMLALAQAKLNRLLDLGDDSAEGDRNSP